MEAHRSKVVHILGSSIAPHPSFAESYAPFPEQAAESAKAAGAQMLVLSHLVPPLPLSYLYPAFLGDAKNRFDGPIVVGEDGMLFSLPPKSKAIERRNLM